VLGPEAFQMPEMKEIETGLQTMVNTAAKVQEVSKEAEDHHFQVCACGGCRGMPALALHCKPGDLESGRRSTHAALRMQRARTEFRWCYDVAVPTGHLARCEV
jgi:hypothetical protein